VLDLDTTFQLWKAVCPGAWLLETPHRRPGGGAWRRELPPSCVVDAVLRSRPGGIRGVSMLMMTSATFPAASESRVSLRPVLMEL
jgi:hypothetical protein